MICDHDDKDSVWSGAKEAQPQRLLVTNDRNSFACLPKVSWSVSQSVYIDMAIICEPKTGAEDYHQDYDRNFEYVSQHVD